MGFASGIFGARRVVLLFFFLILILIHIFILKSDAFYGIFGFFFVWVGEWAFSSLVYVWWLEG